MTICAVVGCSTRSECIKDTNISLHRFPKDPEIQDAWIKAVGRLNWHPTKNSVVCSKHFEEKCFIRGRKYITLNKKAIPTCFLSSPSYHKYSQTKKKRAIAETDSVESVPLNTMDKMQTSSEVNFTLLYPGPVIPNLLVYSSNQNPVENTKASLIRDDIEGISLDTTNGMQTSAEVNSTPLDPVIPNFISSSYEHLDETSTDSCMSSPILSECEEENHDDDDDDDRVSLKRKLDLLSHRYEMAKKKIKRLQQNKRQSDKKIANLEAIIEELKSKNFIHEDNSELFDKVLGPNKEFLARQLAKQLDSSLEKQYSLELRAFALTLYYFSPRAYNYVRDVFNMSLPSEKTIEKWYQATDGKPGVTLEDFEILEPICELIEDNVEFDQ